MLTLQFTLLEVITIHLFFYSSLKLAMTARKSGRNIYIYIFNYIYFFQIAMWNLFHFISRENV